MLGALKDNVKRFAQTSGLLPAYHAMRNERSLTVLTLHRVLPPKDPRAHDADPEWTVSLDQFADCVSFARRHFTVVSLDEVLEARRKGNGSSLPPRPLLLTFDDGWQDNAEHALPILEATSTPSVIFVSSDAIGKETPFWRESIRAAWRGERLSEDIWRDLWEALKKPAPARSDETVEELLGHLFDSLSKVERDKLFAPYLDRLKDGRRHMMTVEELRDVASRGVAIGAHGRTHEPLSRCENLDDELAEPRRTLEEYLGKPVTTLALPHSRHTPEVMRRAEQLGYELVFTGRPELIPTRVIPFSMGRIPIIPDALTDEGGRFRPERLALHLFRRPHVEAWA